MLYSGPFTQEIDEPAEKMSSSEDVQVPMEDMEYEKIISRMIGPHTKTLLESDETGKSPPLQPQPSLQSRNIFTENDMIELEQFLSISELRIRMQSILKRIVDVNKEKYQSDIFELLEKNRNFITLLKSFKSNPNFYSEEEIELFEMRNSTFYFAKGSQYPTTITSLFGPTFSSIFGTTYSSIFGTSKKRRTKYNSEDENEDEGESNILVRQYSVQGWNQQHISNCGGMASSVVATKAVETVLSNRLESLYRIGSLSKYSREKREKVSRLIFNLRIMFAYLTLPHDRQLEYILSVATFAEVVPFDVYYNLCMFSFEMLFNDASYIRQHGIKRGATHFSDTTFDKRESANKGSPISDYELSGPNQRTYFDLFNLFFLSNGIDEYHKIDSATPLKTLLPPLIKTEEGNLTSTFGVFLGVIVDFVNNDESIKIAESVLNVNSYINLITNTNETMDKTIMFARVLKAFPIGKVYTLGQPPPSQPSDFDSRPQIDGADIVKKWCEEAKKLRRKIYLSITIKLNELDVFKTVNVGVHSLHDMVLVIDPYGNRDGTCYMYFMNSWGIQYSIINVTAKQLIRYINRNILMRWLKLTIVKNDGEQIMGGKQKRKRKTTKKQKKITKKQRKRQKSTKSKRK